MAPTVSSQPVAKQSRARRGMLVLAVIQLVLALLIILFGGVAMGMSMKYDYFEFKHRSHSGVDTKDRRRVTMSWVGGTQFWGGVIIVVTAAIGMYSSLRPHLIRLRIICFVLSIIAAAVSAAISILGGIWAFVRDYDFYLYYDEVTPGQNYFPAKSVIGLNGFISFMGFACMITCIISASLWCYQYSSCCRECTNPDPVQIIYMPNSNDPERRLAVSRMQTIPEPGGTAGGQRIATMQVPQHATGGDHSNIETPGPRKPWGLKLKSIF